MVIVQTPCINNTVLQLAETANLGDVFIYANDNYQWTSRQPDWQGLMLTKTDRGFELLDKNGRSHKIVNIGTLLTTNECGSCTKAYVYPTQAECINAVCCGQNVYVGSCGEIGIALGWCDLPIDPEPTYNPPQVRIEAVGA